MVKNACPGTYAAPCIYNNCFHKYYWKHTFVSKIKLGFFSFLAFSPMGYTLISAKTAYIQTKSIYFNFQAVYELINRLWKL